MTGSRSKRVLTTPRSLWFDGYMNHTATINTPDEAKAKGYEVPSWATPTTILVFDNDGELIAWGPEKDRAHHEKVIARFYS